MDDGRTGWEGCVGTRVKPELRKDSMKEPAFATGPARWNGFQKAFFLF